MRVTLLTMHRKESYPGEYGPEVLAVVDEWTMEENPAWWPTEVARQRDLVGSDANAWAEVSIEVTAEDLLAALYPKNAVGSAITSTRPLPGLLAGADPTTHDLSIGVGTWVCDEAAEDADDPQSYARVVKVVDRGYDVVWFGQTDPQFAGTGEVVPVDRLPSAIADSLGEEPPAQV